MGENMDIPEGMKAWVGGAEAPADWDGGPVLLRSGTRGAPSHGANALSWSHPHMEVRGATDLGGDIIAYTPARLASVSSASAETSVGAKQAPTHIWLHGIGDPIGETTWVDDPSPSGCADEEAHAVAYVRADIAASPEPVPATNQAGEVALRAAVASIADDYMTSEVHHPGYVLIPTAKFDELSALATQPATSQEGEIFRLAANLVYRIEAAGALEHEGMNFERWKTTARSLAPSLRSALAATPTPPTLSEDLREESIAAFGAVMFGHIWERFTDDRWDIEINDLVTVDAVKAGLVSVAPYDPEIHNDQSGAAEVGDDFYEITPEGRAALAQVKAS